MPTAAMIARRRGPTVRGQTILFGESSIGSQNKTSRPTPAFAANFGRNLVVGNAGALCGKASPALDWKKKGGQWECRQINGARPGIECLQEPGRFPLTTGRLYHAGLGLWQKTRMPMILFFFGPGAARDVRSETQA